MSQLFSGKDTVQTAMCQRIGNKPQTNHKPKGRFFWFVLSCFGANSNVSTHRKQTTNQKNRPFGLVTFGLCNCALGIIIGGFLSK